jgi:hypothetical protein
MKNLFTAMFVMSFFLLVFTGCGKELNDENFADFYLETYDKDKEYTDELAEEYGWSHVDLGRYLEELKGDDERATFVYQTIAERNREAAEVIRYNEGIRPHFNLKLNDVNFVEFWLKSFEVETEREAKMLAEDYGWTDEDLNNYFEELEANKTRADTLIKSVTDKNEDAGFALELTLFPDQAFERLLRESGNL